MRLTYAFLAKKVRINRNGMLDAFGVGPLEHKRAKFPAPLPPMVIVILLELTALEYERPHTIEIQMWGADAPMLTILQRQLLETKPVDWPRQDVRPVQHVHKIEGIVAHGPGDFDFRIFIDDEPVQTLDFYVGRL